LPRWPSPNPSRKKNLEKGEALIAEAARRGSDLICFPEMWTTGFNWTNNERIARDHERIVEVVGALAGRYRIWINGSMLFLNEEGRVSNTSILFNSEGGRERTAPPFQPASGR
jgi:predicted amidohydrolase